MYNKTSNSVLYLVYKFLKFVFASNVIDRQLSGVPFHFHILLFVEIFLIW
jgi:hypothetical protein